MSVASPAGGAADAGRAWFAAHADRSAKLHVDFNPASLRVSLTNQFGEDPPEQHARATSYKLDVELLFDTTEDGSDVRSRTLLLRDLATAMPGARPRQGGGNQDQANRSLPKVVFHWGTADYVGIIESLTETLDYWSSDGVPLRASIQLAMKGSSEGFFAYSPHAAAYAARSDPAPAPPAVIRVAAPPGGTGATGAATRGGDPRAGRALAAVNGMENMRAGAGVAVAGGADIHLAAAAGFKMSGGVSAGAAASFGMGASAGASASAGIGGSMGVGMAAGIGSGGGFGIGGGLSGGIGGGIGGGLPGGIGGAGFGMGAGASGGIGLDGGGLTMTSSTSVTGLDGVTETRTTTSVTGFDGSTSTTQTQTRSSSVPASAGAFAGLGASKTSGWSAAYTPERLLGEAAPPLAAGASFDRSGRVVLGNGVVAESYARVTRY